MDDGMDQSDDSWLIGLDEKDKTATKCTSYHISMGVEYSVDPSKTSGGRYHSVTTSFE